MSQLRTYYSGIVDYLRSNAGVNLSNFDYYEDITSRFVPAYISFVLALREDEEAEALDKYSYLMDLAGVPTDDEERDWDFSTLKSYFG